MPTHRAVAKIALVALLALPAALPTASAWLAEPADAEATSLVMTVTTFAPTTEPPAVRVVGADATSTPALFVPHADGTSGSWTFLVVLDPVPTDGNLTLRRFTLAPGETDAAPEPTWRVVASPTSR